MRDTSINLIDNTWTHANNLTTTVNSKVRKVHNGRNNFLTQVSLYWGISLTA